MKFLIIKSSLDGISTAGDHRYTLKEVLREIHYSKGWDSLKQLHEAITNWAAKARVGSVFSTAATAIVSVDGGKIEEGECGYCDDALLEFGEFAVNEENEIEQRVQCQNCGCTWIDIFTWSDRKEIKS